MSSKWIVESLHRHGILGIVIKEGLELLVGDLTPEKREAYCKVIGDLAGKISEGAAKGAIDGMRGKG